MLNVMVLNFCYDVPVKLFSAHLVAAAAVIALPEVSRLAQLFCGWGSGKGAPLVYPFSGRGAAVLRGLTKAWLCLVIFILPLILFWRSEQKLAAMRPILGEWRLSTLELTGESVVPKTGEVQALTLSHWQMTPEGEAWKLTGAATLVGGAESAPTVRLTHEEISFELSEAAESLILPGTFTWSRVGSELRLENADVRASFRPVAQDYLLTNRGFHWINEHPFNR